MRFAKIAPVSRKGLNREHGEDGASRLKPRLSLQL
jgi:hypothetical protein